MHSVIPRRFTSFLDENIQPGLYLECSGRGGGVTGEQGVWGTEVPQRGPGA